MLVMRAKLSRKSSKTSLTRCGSFHKSSGVLTASYERNEKTWGTECYADSASLCVAIISGWAYVEVCHQWHKVPLKSLITAVSRMPIRYELLFTPSSSLWHCGRSSGHWILVSLKRVRVALCPAHVSKRVETVFSTSKWLCNLFKA